MAPDSVITQSDEIHKAGGKIWSRLKLLLATALIGVLALFLIQNTEVVEVQFLLYTLSMSRAFVLLGAVLIGFVLGVIGSFFFR